MLRSSQIELQTYGPPRYTTSTLLTSSASLGWSTIGAEFRSHGVVETPVMVTTHVEVCFVALGNEDCLITRTGTGQTQQLKATTGTICLSPVGVDDKQITATAPVPKALHLFLPASLFRRLGDDFNLPGMPAHSIRYAAGVRDAMIEQIGLSIISEMTNETAAGRMFVETASLTLAARLLHMYCDSGARLPVPPDSQLNHVRLRRVLDYIAAHFADEITLADLAGVACLSPFHFARTFTRAMGISPHRYVSRMRLQSAMADVAAGKMPLAQIALKARFSSQASFTRAFRRATGLTPRDYGRRRRQVPALPAGYLSDQRSTVARRRAFQ